MNYLYLLITVSAGVFALFTAGAVQRLNKHTDTQAKFLIAAKAYNFSPFKSMAKRTAKYFICAAALLLIALIGTAAIYGAANKLTPDLALTAAVFGVSLAAYTINGALILFCAMAYVRYKIRYTPIL